MMYDDPMDNEESGLDDGRSVIPLQSQRQPTNMQVTDDPYSSNKLVASPLAANQAAKDLICSPNPMNGVNLCTVHDGDKQIARCTSTLHRSSLNRDWLLIESISCFHVSAIILTVVFNLLQNIFSIFHVVDTHKQIPIEVAYTLIAFDILGTTVQNLWARSLKIVEIPRHLTYVQSVFIDTIEKELKQLERTCQKGRFIKDFVILMSPEEYDEISVDTEPTANTRSRGSSPTKNGITQTLQILSKEYHDVRLHILQIMDTSRIQELLDLILSPEVPPKFYKVLAYSLQYNSPQEQHSVLANVIIPSLSLRRALFSTAYFNAICDKKKVAALFKDTIKQIPALFFLKIGPALCTLLQGPATLADMLEKFGLINHSQTNIYVKLTIVLFGCLVGAFKAYVTFMIKTEVAEERLSYLFNLIRLPKLSDVFLIPQLVFSLIQALSLPLLCVLYLPYSLINYFFEPKNKMWLDTALHLDPVPDRIIQFIASLGTIYFYFGLGFFFSGSGLIYIATALSIPMPAEDNYSNPYFLAFRMFSCISQVLVNAIFNQGWDVITKSSERIEKKQKENEQKRQKIDTRTQGPSDLNLSQRLISPNTANSIPNSNGQGVNAWRQKIILCCILIDSFVFGVSAMAGTSKANEVGKKLVPFMFNPILLFSLPITVGLGIFFSQIIYSFVLGGRDSEKSWKMISQHYTPRFVKEFFKIEHSVLYPATTRRKNVPGDNFDVLDGFLDDPFDTKESSPPFYLGNN
ncbi:MAG: hypothetical protein KBD83_03380 [Gammaproteobacteria bacterium]|nr:hypothetical protein [Gammaproteobacteria bacterium]